MWRYTKLPIITKERLRPMLHDRYLWSDKQYAIDKIAKKNKIRFNRLKEAFNAI